MKLKDECQMTLVKKIYKCEMFLRLREDSLDILIIRVSLAGHCLLFSQRTLQFIIFTINTHPTSAANVSQYP